MNDKERLKIILDNSIYDHNFEEFTVPLKDMDWLINQAERVEELEAKYSRLEEHFKSIKEDKEFYQKQAYKLEERVEELEEKYSRLEESFKKQTTNAFDGWEKVIELEKENENYEQALEFGIKYLQVSNIGQVQIVVQAMKEALEGETK